MRGVVVTYPMGHAALHNGHMAATRNELARHLATLTGFAYAGDYDALRHGDTPTYFVPSDTMTTETASRAGVQPRERPLRRRRASSVRGHQNDYPPPGRHSVSSADRLVRRVSPARRRCRAARLQCVRHGGRAGGWTQDPRAWQGAREARRRNCRAWSIRRGQRDRSRSCTRCDRPRRDGRIRCGHRAGSRRRHHVQHRAGPRGRLDRDVLRNAVHDDEQSRRGSLRRVRDHRRTRRFRRIDGIALA